MRTCTACQRSLQNHQYYKRADKRKLMARCIECTSCFARGKYNGLSNDKLLELCRQHKWNRSIKPVDGTKLCSACNRKLPISRFYKQLKQTQSRCMDCVRCIARGRKLGWSADKLLDVCSRHKWDNVAGFTTIQRRRTKHTQQQESPRPEQPSWQKGAVAKALAKNWS